MALVGKGICDHFAAHWMDVGYCLDFDPDGNEVDLIEEQGNGNPKKCCRLLMKTWIQEGKGKKPKTWQTLLDILITLDRKAAHDKVKEELQYIQSEQQKKAHAQEMVKVSQPVEETDTGSMLMSLSSMPRTQSPSSLKRHQNNISLPREAERFEFQTDYQPIGSSQD